MIWLDDEQPLPPPGTTPEDEAPGLVAAGGALTTGRLGEAYRLGLFPWYGPGQPVLWWSPDPRMVLATADFRLHPSLRKTLRRFLRTPGCEIRFDSDFDAVIAACARTPRDGQDGTWIVPEMQRAYGRWHREGVTHSVETRIDGELVGGLYFVSIGRMVFGESMFSQQTDASKFALAALVAACRARAVPLIDCQQHTGHLARFGAAEIPRVEFIGRLAPLLVAPSIRDWSYDPGHWAFLDDRLLTEAAGPERPAEPERR